VRKAAPVEVGTELDRTSEVVPPPLMMVVLAGTPGPVTAWPLNVAAPLGTVIVVGAIADCGELNNGSSISQHRRSRTRDHQTGQGSAAVVYDAGVDGRTSRGQIQIVGSRCGTGGPAAMRIKSTFWPMLPVAPLFKRPPPPWATLPIKS